MGITRAEARIEIAAPVGDVYGTLVDHAAIPEWQATVERVDVLRRDAEGRGVEVEFFVDIKVKKLRYVNEFTHHPPQRLEFRLLEGDLKHSEGDYEFEALGEDRTLVKHHLAVDPGRFVPGPIKRMLTQRLLKDTLSDLKRRCEQA